MRNAAPPSHLNRPRMPNSAHGGSESWPVIGRLPEGPNLERVSPVKRVVKMPDSVDEDGLQKPCNSTESPLKPIINSFKISSSLYKHHRKVISNLEKRFNSQSKRFQYNQASVTSQFLSSSATDSFLAPSVSRFHACKKTPNHPAANAYKTLPRFQSKQDFSKGNSSEFQQPIAGKTEKIPAPAPNQYRVRRLGRADKEGAQLICDVCEVTFDAPENTRTGCNPPGLGTALRVAA
ncbi:LOW QUALITY PROTEIN: O(6)-methylguanine-induced apoptosis 2, partial [Theristicus caerulescens]